MKRGLLWFRDDLRLNDNPALAAAVAGSEAIVPVFVLDERLLQRDRWGFLRMGPYRLQFLLESLQDLADHLAEKGSRLQIVRGLPEQVIPELAAKYQCGQVFAAKAYTHEEIRAEQDIAEKVDLSLHHGSTLIHPDDVPFATEQLPDVFTQFRKRVEKYSRVRPLVEAPGEIVSPELPPAELPTPDGLGLETPPPDERRVLAFQGGAMAAYRRLDHYLWDSDAVASYKKTRNGLIGGDYSTKFSPWLANGSISPRAIYHEVEAYESERTSNSSTYWVKFELLWRDYFKFVAMRYGRKIFFPGGIQDKSVDWQDKPRIFEKWQTGQTGDRFVDANMRELLYTGFMSNRGRQNVASYLVHQLREDWRKGAAWFESLLIDYDPASNYGNWMYAGGVGNDPRDRVFNTKKQASMYDGDGAYRQLWLDGNGRTPPPAAMLDQFF